MKTVYDIIIAPVITEDSMAMSADKKYAFKVLSDATKPEIAAAVEKAFKVDVKYVNIINVKKQPRRYGVHSGYKSAWKKAIVTLKEDSKPIEFFEGLN